MLNVSSEKKIQIWWKYIKCFMTNALKLFSFYRVIQINNEIIMLISFWIRKKIYDFFITARRDLFHHLSNGFYLFGVYKTTCLAIYPWLYNILHKEHPYPKTTLFISLSDHQSCLYLWRPKHTKFYIHPFLRPPRLFGSIQEQDENVSWERKDG